jgi:penicillin-binding protein 1C
MDNVIQASWFILPPLQEYYFRAKNFSYKILPPFRKDCQRASSLVSMDHIYPKNDSKIFIPRELDGTMGKVVFELAHSDPKAVVYWHLDGEFIGTTTGTHNLSLNPPQGEHFLTVVDENGDTENYSFRVISYM